MFSLSSGTTLPTVPGYAGMFQTWSVVDESPGEATSWHYAGEVPVHCVLLGMSVLRLYIQCWSPLQERTRNGTPVMTPNATQSYITPHTNGMRRKSLPESAVVIQRGSAMISARRKASVAAEALARKSSQCSTPAGMSRAKPGVVVGFILIMLLVHGVTNWSP